MNQIGASWGCPNLFFWPSGALGPTGRFTLEEPEGTVTGGIREDRRNGNWGEMWDKGRDFGVWDKEKGEKTGDCLARSGKVRTFAALND